ncbi:MAG: MFS transporter [Mediterraneibacter sp.]
MQSQQVKLWNKDFILIIVINFLVFMNHLMILSTFPFYIEYLGGSEAVAGFAAALFSIIAVVFRPFISWMLDNGKRKIILIIGLCGMALMPIGYLVFATLYLAFVCRMLHGASLAFSNTSTSTIATDIIPKPRFAEGMGMFGLATALATAVAPALGLALMDYMGFTMLFLFAAVSIVIALILFLMMKVPKVEVEKKPLNLKGLIDKDAVPASATALVFMLTYGALENFTAKFAAEQNLPSGGIFFAVMAVALLLTRLLAGKVTDRHGESFFAYSCNAAMLIAFLLMGLFPNVVTYLLAAVLAGFGFGGLEPALQSMAVAIAPPERRGSANSTFLCAYDIGIGVGGGIAGVLISSFGYSQMFVIMTVFNILSVVIYVLWGRNHPSSFTYRRKHHLN